MNARVCITLARACWEAKRRRRIARLAIGVVLVCAALGATVTSAASANVLLVCLPGVGGLPAGSVRLDPDRRSTPRSPAIGC